MQFLYSAFSLSKLAQSALHIITLGDLLHPSPAQLPGEYTPADTLQGATGNLSTIAISVYSQVLILWLSEPRHHCRHP